MLRVFGRAVRLFLGLTLVLFVLGWLFLLLPIFAPQRIAIAEKALTGDIGMPVTVAGDARLKIGRTIRMVVEKADIASPTDSAVEFISAEKVQLEFDLSDLLKRQIVISDIELDGAVLNLTKFKDGRNSWSKSSTTAGAEPANEDVSADASEPGADGPDNDKPGLLDRVGIDIRNSSVNIENRISGFEFLLEVDSLDLQRPAVGQTEVAAKGAVNGQPLTIDGNYSTDAPFAMTAKVGDTNIRFDGKPIADADGQGHTARLTSQVDQMADVLKALGLQSTLEGQGSLDVDLAINGKHISVDKFAAVVNHQDGKQFKAVGSVDNLPAFSGITTTISARLFPEGQGPPNAEDIQDIKITDVTVDLKGDIKDLQVQSLVIQTNAFQQGIDQIGQVSISKLRRSPEGKLEIQDIRVQAGPKNAPYFQASGSVGDAILVEDIDLTGSLDLPVSALLKFAGKDQVQAFGVIDGDFSVNGLRSGHSVSRFSAESSKTDLWRSKTDVTLTIIDDIRALGVKSNVEVPDPAKFLTALDIAPVEGGPLAINLDVLGGQWTFDNKITVSSGKTQTDIAVNFKVEETGPIIRGALSSEQVKVSDVRDGVAFLIKLGKRIEAAEKSEDVQPLVLPDDRVVQPLVLEDTREVQPLVLDDDTTGPETAQPEQDAKSAAREYLNVDTIAKRADVEIGIDIKKVVGTKGVSEVKSELIARDGKVAFGPLNVALDGGHLNFGAKMDVIKRPGLVSVSGSTGGWDLGKIMSSIGSSIGAQGVLSGRFALSGSNRSIDRFVKTMVGDAEIFMGHGRIDTSLLKLAGFGVIPWLFSKELRRGYAEIVCVDAPVRIDHGTVTTNSFVLETQEVQLVARGTVDMANDTISVHAEPRPVGRPMARSAVPVDISGKLSDPQVHLELGGKRAVRDRNAGAIPADRKPCKPDIDQLR